MWRDLGFLAAARRLTREEARSGGAVDLEGTGAFLVQVKRGKRPNVFGALEKLNLISPLDAPRLVMARRDNESWTVAMPWWVFKHLMDSRCKL